MTSPSRFAVFSLASLGMIFIFSLGNPPAKLLRAPPY
jgi:hypothetical protein